MPGASSWHSKVNTSYYFQSKAETSVKVWYAVVSKAQWKSPADIKIQFGVPVDFAGDDRVIFDLSGNKYRLIVHIG